MDELIILKHAKDYIDKLAKGVNPLDDSELPDEDIVNNVKICRCLNYVSGVLANDIDCMENGNKKKTKKSVKGDAPLYIATEKLEQFPYFADAVSLSDIIKELNNILNEDAYRKLKYADIADWMIDVGLLTAKQDDTGRIVRRATPMGEELGMKNDVRHGMRGDYIVVVYDLKSQHYIIDNIDSVLDKVNNAPRTTYKRTKWTLAENQQLMQLYQENIDIKEIADKLGKSVDAVKKRLRRNGVIL